MGSPKTQPAPVFTGRKKNRNLLTRRKTERATSYFSILPLPLGPGIIHTHTHTPNTHCRPCALLLMSGNFPACHWHKCWFQWQRSAKQRERGNFRTMKHCFGVFFFLFLLLLLLLLSAKGERCQVCDKWIVFSPPSLWWRRWWWKVCALAFFADSLTYLGEQHTFTESAAADPAETRAGTQQAGRAPHDTHSCVHVLTSWTQSPSSSWINKALKPSDLILFFTC